MLKGGIQIIRVGNTRAGGGGRFGSKLLCLKAILGFSKDFLLIQSSKPINAIKVSCIIYMAHIRFFWLKCIVNKQNHGKHSIKLNVSIFLVTCFSLDMIVKRYFLFWKNKNIKNGCSFLTEVCFPLMTSFYKILRPILLVNVVWPVVVVIVDVV